LLKKSISIWQYLIEDILIAFFGLLVASPILLLTIFLIWKQDKKSPFYMAPRVGSS
jgi:lipopolysaccharide/colanic/teichoic acid biosynthesis glycosyltransferase